MGAISKVVRFFGGGGSAAPQADVPHEPAQERIDSLSLPQVELARLETIESALESLRPGESRFVDIDGGVYSDKTPFVKREVKPLASFTLRRDGTYSVYAGIPSLNPTYCGVDVNDRMLGKAVEYETVLRSGNWIGLGPDCVVRIPHKPLSEIKTGEDLLAASLALGAPGASIELGRNVSPRLPDTVSRIHVTVEIVDKIDRGPEESELVIKVRPGIPAEQTLLVRPGGVGFEVVHGQRTVAPGSRVLLGELGDVVLPHPRGTLGERAKHISSLLSRGSAEQAGKEMEQATGSHGVEQARCLQARFLESHIILGLDLIKAERFEDALRFFSAPQALKLVGYELNQGRHHNRKHEREVGVATGGLADGVKPTNIAQQKLLDHFQKGAALSHAEEYTHALQHLHGGNVSRFGAVLESGDYEADVAVFFTEQGIDCSDMFAQGRNKERALAVARLRGLQTPAHEESFRQALHELPLGEKLYLGRDAHRDAPNERVFSIFRDGVAGESQSISDARSAARESLAPIEATIERSNDGSFVLSRYGASGNGQIHAPDTAGYFRALEDSVRLEPGTSFYLGGAFRFVLVSDKPEVVPRV